jgi:hypothetical protein
VTASLIKAAADAGARGGSWRSVGKLPAALNWQSPDENAVLLDDGRVLVAGGTGAGFASVADCSVFDPDPGTWQKSASLSRPRALHTLTRLKDGSVLAAGGYAADSGFAGVATVERYYPKDKVWKPTTPMTRPRSAHTATLLADGRVLVTGGYADRAGTVAATSAAEVYDPKLETWTPTTTPMIDSRAGHQAVLLRDSRVLVIGGTVATGDDGAYTGLAFCEIFTPATDSWTPTGGMARPRWNNTTSLLPDGSVLVTGGGWPSWIDGWVYNSLGDWTAERYNPTTGLWSRDDDLSCARVWHRAVPLPDGRLLIMGGGNGVGLMTGFRSCAVYDPLTRGWEPAAGMATGRWGFLAVPLPDGQVLVAGGIEHINRSAGPWLLTDSTEIYAPGISTPAEGA